MHALGLSIGNTLGNYTAYNASGGGGGGGSAPSAATLRMSHLSAGRPYITFLAPAETNADGARRLHIKTFADSAS